MWKYILATSGLCLMLACQPSQPDGHSHGEDSHTHAEDVSVSVSHTEWSDQVELFVEFKPLVVGETSRFAAHFTKLDDYKPIREGQVTVSLIIENKGIRHTVEAPSSPGIFTPNLEPTTSGKGNLIFDLTTPELSERVIIKGIRVFSSMKEAATSIPVDGAGDNAIDFLKEQAWKIDFQVHPVQNRPLSDVIKTSGKILLMQGDEQVISSPSSGIVVFANQKMLPGRTVKKGEHLFSLLSTGDPSDNLEAKLEVAKATFKKAEAEYLRRKDLLKDEAVSQKDFEASALEYNLANVTLENLSKYLSEGGRKVYASKSGYIKDIDKEPGDFVETGTSILTITQNRKLQLVADVPQQYFHKIKQLRNADFKTMYSNEWQSIEEYNGRLLGYAPSISLNQPFIPVYFELNNTGSLLPGSYVELALYTDSIKETITIPRSALIEEYGSYFAMVQLTGESFEKRLVKPGLDNGDMVQIIDGIELGEMVVTEGAYQIKMASMASSIPAHGHTH